MPATGFNALYGGTTYTGIQSRSATIHQIGRLLYNRRDRKLIALFDALIGAAVGGTALATHKRVAAVNYPYPPGAVETVTDINRATTSLDRATLRQIDNENDRAVRLTGQRLMLGQQG